MEPKDQRVSCSFWDHFWQMNIFRAKLQAVPSFMCATASYPCWAHTPDNLFVAGDKRDLLEREGGFSQGQCWWQEHHAKNQLVGLCHYKHRLSSYVKIIEDRVSWNNFQDEPSIPMVITWDMTGRIQIPGNAPPHLFLLFVCCFFRDRVSSV